MSVYNRTLERYSDKVFATEAEPKSLHFLAAGLALSERGAWYLLIGVRGESPLFGIVASFFILPSPR